MKVFLDTNIALDFIMEREDNPCLEAVTKEFEETSFLLSQKPE